MTSSMIILKTSEIMHLIPQVPAFQRLTDIKRVNDIFMSLQEDLLADKQILLPGCIILAKTKRPHGLSTVCIALKSISGF